MKRINKRAQAILGFSLFCLIVTGQEQWEVPVDESEKLSIFLFDDDKQLDGKLLYTSSCISCHGNPTRGNFTPMVPPPGDIASEQFQIQTDGNILYKIKKGRGSMPAFENSFSDNEIWNIVAYIRSFNEGYEQTLPDLEGIEIPKLALTIDYDENVDKLVVTVTDSQLIAMEDVVVKAYIQGMFGNYLLGSSSTNSLGLAWFDIDSKIPGDVEGFVPVLVKATKGFGSAKLAGNVKAATPTIKEKILEGRHLWSSARKAPFWMIIIFNLIGAGVWGTIFYILAGLRKIKKLQ